MLRSTFAVSRAVASIGSSVHLVAPAATVALRASKANGGLTLVMSRGYSSPSPAVSEAEDTQSDIDNTAQKSKDPLDLDNYEISARRRGILEKMGVKKLFEIQAKTFDAIAGGRDIVARAQTGSGKTLGFALPIVEKLAASPRSGRNRLPACLVMAPTRELAKQVASAFGEVSPELSVQCVYGGAPYFQQASELRRGVDVLVATPGRLLDLMQRGDVALGNISFVVLDEADEMLRVGFKEQVDEILKSTPAQRQTLLFSATMPPWVKQICQTHLKDPTYVDLVGNRKIKVVSDVKHLAIEVPGSREMKDQILADLVSHYSHDKCIVFTATKRQADLLVSQGGLREECQVLHGDIAQSSRELTLQAFRDGVFRVLVATDVAARGLDIPEIDLVVQYDVPTDTEGYVHRSGRTGRAGRSGTAIVMFRPNERRDVDELARNIGTPFEFIKPPCPLTLALKKGERSMETVNSVSADTVSVFRSVAATMTKERDPIDVLAGALAVLSGYKDGITKRSLITAEHGFQTMHLIGRFRSRGHAIQEIVAAVPEIMGKIGSVRKVSDGVVFDAPARLVDQLTSKSEAVPAKTLPPLLEFDGERDGNRDGSRDGSRDGRGFGGRDGGRDGGRGFGGRDGGRGFGGRDGGRDGGRGGFGGRDGGRGGFGGRDGGRDGGRGGFGGRDGGRGGFGGRDGGRGFGGADRGFGNKDAGRGFGDANKDAGEKSRADLFANW